MTDWSHILSFPLIYTPHSHITLLSSQPQRIVRLILACFLTVICIDSPYWHSLRWRWYRYCLSRFYQCSGNKTSIFPSSSPLNGPVLQAFYIEAFRSLFCHTFHSWSVVAKQPAILSEWQKADQNKSAIWKKKWHSSLFLALSIFRVMGRLYGIESFKDETYLLYRDSVRTEL